MGYGDFKLLAALGAWLGWQMILPDRAAGLGASAPWSASRMKLRRHPARRPLRALRPLPGRRRPRGHACWPAACSTGWAGSGCDAAARAGSAAAHRPDRRHRQRQEHGRRDAGRPAAPRSSTPTPSRAQLTAPGGAAMPALARAFGADDHRRRRRPRPRPHARARLRRPVGASARLEAILHPLIGAEAQRQAAAAGDRPVVFDVPLLAESSHWRAARRPRAGGRLQRGDADRSASMRRSGWTRGRGASASIAQQAPRAARRAIADAVIFNDGLTLDAAARRGAAPVARWVGQTR